jgi:hypothetical protein
MDQKLKTKWIAALRSGDYKQGKMQLFDGERHCCLGVLCIVINKENPEWTYNHDLIGTKNVDILWRMNDGDDEFKISKHNFNQIADWIEKKSII